MNQILEMLKYFETAPLDDAKYAAAFLQRIIVARKNQSTADRKRKRNGKSAPVFGSGTPRQLKREGSIAARTERALEAAGKPMRTAEITAALAEDGLEPPAIDSVRAALNKEIGKGDRSRIARPEDGLYALRG